VVTRGGGRGGGGVNPAGAGFAAEISERPSFGWRQAWRDFGINIAQAPEVAEQRTIALAARGVSMTAEALARLILDRIAHWRDVIEVEGFAPVRAAWLDLALDPAAGQAQFDLLDHAP